MRVWTWFSLILGDNALSNLSPEVPNLQRLDLGFNQLETLPPELERIPSLQLVCNAFTDLTPELEQMVMAQESNLSSHWGGVLPCRGYAGPGNDFAPTGATPNPTATP